MGRVATPTGGRRRTSLWAAAGVGGAVGSVLALTVVALTVGFGEQVREQPVVREATPTALDDSRLEGVAAIAARVSPAIGRLEVTGPGGQATGSGVLFRDDGHLLTSAHLVAGATALAVTLADGTRHEGELVGADGPTDVGVVRISDAGERRFPTAVLGSAVGLHVGEPAIAVGSPVGSDGGPSVTVGVVSALGQRVAAEGGTPLVDMIQTDAPPAPGSWGGPLVDHSGTVVGITTAVTGAGTGQEGLRFATPIDIARAVAEDLIATGTVERVWLGVEGTDYRPADDDPADGGPADDDPADDEMAPAALVRRVFPGSPADRAGFEPGDVIVAVDDVPVGSMAALVVALRARDPGDVVAIGYRRDGHESTMRVELARRPDAGGGPPPAVTSN